MKRSTFVTSFLTLCFGLALQASAQPIKPNQGEGKYRFCQRMYDSCMTGVFGTPGSQGYNTGQARCRAKWNTCRKTSTWNVSTRAATRIDSYGDEFAAKLDAEDATN